MIHPSKFGSRSAIGRTVVAVIVIVVIVLVAGVGYYVSISKTSSTTTQSQSVVTSTVTSVQTSVATSTATSTAVSTVTTTAGPTTSTTSTSAAGVPTSITVEMNLAVGSLDPNAAGGGNDFWVVKQAYETLYTFNQTSGSSAYIPWLATGYTESANGSVWTFTLRQGVTFSDGTPFNATAVKDSLDWQIISHADQGYTNFIALIRGAAAFLGSNQNATNVANFENNDGITIVNPYTIQFSLVTPYVAFLNLMSVTQDLSIISPSYVLAHGGVVPGKGIAALQTASAGTGPYIVTSYNPATGTTVLTKNPNWWAAKTFGIKQPFQQVTDNYVANSATEELDVRSGVADMIQITGPQLYDFANKADWSQGTLVSTVPSVSLWGVYPLAQANNIVLNDKIKTSSGALASVQPFQNANITLGLRYSWNDTAFIQSSLNGVGLAMSQILLPGQLGYNNSLSYPQYNLAKADANLKAGCAQLGCSSKNPITVTAIAFNDPISQAAAATLASTVNGLNDGIVISIVTVTPAVAFGFISTGEYGINVSGGAGVALPDGYAQPFNTNINPLSGFGAIASGFNNTQMYNLLLQASATANQTARTAIYSELNYLFTTYGNNMPSYQAAYVYATSPRVTVIGWNAYDTITLPLIIEMGAGVNLP